MCIRSLTPFRMRFLELPGWKKKGMLRTAWKVICADAHGPSALVAAEPSARGLSAAHVDEPHGVQPCRARELDKRALHGAWTDADKRPIATKQ